MTRFSQSPQARALSAFLAVALFSAPLLTLAEPARMGVITGDGVTLRAGPGVTHDKVGRLTTGDWVTILETTEKWYKILDPHGQVAWVFSRWVDEVPASPQTPGSDLLSITTIDDHDTAADTTVIAPPPLLVTKEGRSLPWLWIGAGIAAAGVIGALALSGGEETANGSLSFHVVFP
jgi:hypothetical protein